MELNNVGSILLSISVADEKNATFRARPGTEAASETIDVLEAPFLKNGGQGCFKLSLHRQKSLAYLVLIETGKQHYAVCLAVARYASFVRN